MTFYASQKINIWIVSRKCFDTQPERNDILRSNKGMSQSLEILPELTSTLFCWSRKVFQCCSTVYFKGEAIVSDEMIDSLCFARSYFVRK